jgi:hypothetical protein
MAPPGFSPWRQAARLGPSLADWRGPNYPQRGLSQRTRNPSDVTVYEAARVRTVVKHDAASSDPPPSETPRASSRHKP